MRTPDELKKSLDTGEVLVVFHNVGENMYGFSVTKSNVNIWQPPDPRRLRTGLGNFLRALGNYGPNHDLSVAELKGDTWRKAAKDTYAAIFKDSRIDVGKTTSLVVVPDNLLWYLPFEALIPPGKTEKILADHFPVRYGPTAALAVSNPRPLRRVQHTGILPGDLKFAGEEAERAKLLQQLTDAVAGPLVLPEPLQQPARLVSPLLDSLIVFDDLGGETFGDASTLLPRSRNAAKDKSNAWISLPYGGPERIVLTGFKTEAEQGLRGGSRYGASRAEHRP